MPQWISTPERAEGLRALPWIGNDHASVLAHREICRSSPRDVFSDSLHGFFYAEGRVEALTPRPDLSESLLRAARLNQVTVAFVRFGSEVMLDGGVLGAYHVNVPLSGSVASVCGARETVATPTRAAVFTPREHAVLPSWGANASQIYIKIEKAALEAELEALLGHPIAGDVRFELAMDLTTPHAQSWLSVLRLILSELDRPGSLLEHSNSHRDHLEKLLISGLLQAQAHDRRRAEHGRIQLPAMPAVALARRLVEQGRIGQVRHVRGASCRTGSWIRSSRWSGGCRRNGPAPARWVTSAPAFMAQFVTGCARRSRVGRWSM